MIAEWRVCADCGIRFGLTRRQCHAGLRRQTRRCAADRVRRHRARQAAWARNRRKSAPTQANPTTHRPLAAFTTS